VDLQFPYHEARGCVPGRGLPESLRHDRCGGTREVPHWLQTDPRTRGYDIWPEEDTADEFVCALRTWRRTDITSLLVYES
jgi:hypothetical protein